MIRKIFLFLFVSLSTGWFAVLPVDAQQGAQIKDSCKLVRDIHGDFVVANDMLIGGQNVHQDKNDIKIVHKDSLIADSTVLMKDKVTVTDETGAKAVANDFQLARISDIWGNLCLINTVNSVVDWVFFILLAVSFALIAYAGFLWMTGGANTENQEKARTIIMGALVGILIAIVARIIPAVVVGILL